ncbi:MAG: hypothetical protein G01um101470_238 [Parcubacteria group bacterium Gr01-1014_70]|nr:MAG: hypothetical protein G01um101470_238 [Parcubacteria group bacterium Gr01-1014_70]
MNEDQTPEENIVPREDQALSKKERRELRREEKRTAADSFRKARSLRRAVLWIIAIAAIGGAIAGAAYFAMNAGDKADSLETMLRFRSAIFRSYKRIRMPKTPLGQQKPRVFRVNSGRCMIFFSSGNPNGRQNRVRRQRLSTTRKSWV